MQNIIDFLSSKRKQYLKRAEKSEETIESIKRCIRNNEKAYGEISGYPKAIIPDENGRERLCSEISKQNALLAKVELIEELQERYFAQHMLRCIEYSSASSDLKDIIKRLEEKLKQIRKEQSAYFIKHDGYCTPEQGMRSGMIKAYLEIIDVLTNLDGDRK